MNSEILRILNENLTEEQQTKLLRLVAEEAFRSQRNFIILFLAFFLCLVALAIIYYFQKDFDERLDTLENRLERYENKFVLLESKVNKS